MPVPIRIARADQAGERGGLAHRPRFEADEGLHPGERLLGERAAHLPHLRQQRRPGKAVDGGAGRDGGPHLVARNVRRIGEEQERARGECRVDEVHPGAAEHFLAQHHAEADAERRLPQRRGRRQDQREQDAGDEKALVDLEPTDHGEQHFPRQADDHRHDVERQEVERAMDDARGHAVRRIADPEPADDVVTPAGQRRELGRVEREVRLQPGVVQRHVDAGQRGDDDQHHHPFEIERVAHMRAALGHRRRGVQERVGRFPERVEAFQPAAFGEVRPDAVEQRAQRLHATRGVHRYSSSRVNMSRSSGPYSYLPGQTNVHSARSSSSSSRTPCSSAHSMLRVISARSRKVGIRSIGITRS